MATSKSRRKKDQVQAGVSEDELSDALEMLGKPVYSLGHGETEVYQDPDGTLKPKKKTPYIKLSVAFRERMLQELKGSRLAVFLCIGLHMDETNRAWPSINTIAQETGYSVREVIYAIGELKEKKILSIFRQHRKGNVYSMKAYVAMGKKNNPVVLGAESAPNGDEVLHQNAPKDVTECTQEPENMSQNAPQEEPIEKKNQREEEDGSAGSPSLSRSFSSGQQIFLQNFPPGSFSSEEDANLVLEWESQYGLPILKSFVRWAKKDGRQMTVDEVVHVGRKWVPKWHPDSTPTSGGDKSMPPRDRPGKVYR